MRPLLLAALLAACSSDPSVTPDPTTAAGTGGAPSASAVGVGGEGGATSADAASSSEAASTTTAEASTSSSSASSGTGGAAPGGGYEDGSRLRAVTIDGADGSKQPVGWYDTQRSEACGFRVASDGQLRCLPIATSATSYFLDAACTQPLGYYPDGCSPPPYISTAVGQAYCAPGDPYAINPASGSRLYSTGAEIDLSAGVQIFIKGGATCAATTSSSAYDYYQAAGGEVPATSFVAATYAGAQ